MPVSDPAANSRLISGWLISWKFFTFSTPVKSGAEAGLTASLAWPGRFTVAVNAAAAHAFKGENAARQQSGIAAGQGHFAPQCAGLQIGGDGRGLVVPREIAAQGQRRGAVSDARKIEVERHDRHPVAHRHPVQPGIDVETPFRRVVRRCSGRGAARLLVGAGAPDLGAVQRMAPQQIVVAARAARQLERQVVERPHPHRGKIQHRQLAIAVEVGGAAQVQHRPGDADGLVLHHIAGREIDADVPRRGLARASFPD